jgi:hypothetical protein
MYVPPYDSLLRRFGTTRDTIDAEKNITIPASFFKLLLQLALAYSDFDEDGYLAANPDVQDAIKKSQIESGRIHYIGYGYFEGRLGGMGAVDESWYLRKYPDVAAAIRENRIKSAVHHFNLIGGGEGRSPNADQDRNAVQWKRSLNAG